MHTSEEDSRKESRGLTNRMNATPRIPLDEIREQIAATIWLHVSAHDVPRVCKAVGIQDAVHEEEKSEAFSSKRRYVKNRLLEKSKAELLQIASNVLEEFDAPKLRNLLSESTVHAEHRVSTVVRKDVLQVLDALDNLSGETPLLDTLASVFGKEVLEGNPLDVFLSSGKTLADEITRHYLHNPDWTPAQVLEECGILTCGQAQFFELLERILHPLARRGSDQTDLAQKLSVALRRDGFEIRQTGILSGYAIYGVVRAQTGVAGTMKNLIFASTGEKPELIIRDAVNNDVEIVRNADKVLIYDRPLPPLGQFLWKDLLSWWQERENIADETAAKDSLYKRLLQSVLTTQSPGEFAIFRGYYERFGTRLGPNLPVLIPQVYLHYDPYTKRERGDEEFLVRQRMDFLLMLENSVRIVIEVDGRHHYGVEDPARHVYIADAGRYAAMCREDRRLRLLGYEVYRFGGAELSDTTLSPLKIGPASQEAVSGFFDWLLRKHGVLKG